ncbi:hypothetical protein SAFG77S_08182 [Streptomyces afghaniensis]
MGRRPDPELAAAADSGLRSRRPWTVWPGTGSSCSRRRRTPGTRTEFLVNYYFRSLGRTAAGRRDLGLVRDLAASTPSGSTSAATRRLLRRRLPPAGERNVARHRAAASASRRSGPLRSGDSGDDLEMLGRPRAMTTRRQLHARGQEPGFPQVSPHARPGPAHRLPSPPPPLNRSPRGPDRRAVTERGRPWADRNLRRRPASPSPTCARPAARCGRV